MMGQVAGAEPIEPVYADDVLPPNNPNVTSANAGMDDLMSEFDNMHVDRFDLRNNIGGSEVPYGWIVYDPQVGRVFGELQPEPGL